MKEAFYYLNLNSQLTGDLGKDDRVSDKRELLVNCAGSINTSRIHTSENAKGRLDYYLLYTIKGTHKFTGNGSTAVLSEGDVIILPPKTSYSQQFTGGELNYLWVHFTGSNIEELLGELDIKIYPSINKTEQPNHLQTRFIRLFNCFLKNDNLRERDLSASYEKLLVELSRAIKTYNKPRNSLSKSLNHINSNYNSKISIPELARLEGMSVTRYNACFKAQLGIPPTKYIIQLRMNTAKELISTSDLSLYQVAELCGYEDYNFFAKVFKSTVGCSPKKYKAIYPK